MNDPQPIGAFTTSALVGWATAATGAIALEGSPSIAGEQVRLMSPYLGAGIAALVAAIQCGAWLGRAAAIGLVGFLASSLFGVVVFDYLAGMSLLSIDPDAALLVSGAGGSIDLLRWRAALHSAVLVPLGAIIGVHWAPSDRR